jgi:hypothetical protein
MREYGITEEVKYVCPVCENALAAGALERVTRMLRFMFGPNLIKCKAINESTGEPCGGYATLRKCRYCDREIPKTALETPNLPFSIVGVSNSGKTNYITIMLHELAKASELQLALAAENPDTRNHQKNNESLIYDKHTIAESTVRGEPLPQIWSVKNLQKKRGSTVPTYTFTIFDGAGEDHANMEPSATVCRYISVSRAIILVIDPLTLSSIRQGGVVDPKVLRNSLAGSQGATKDATAILNSLAEYIKTMRGIGAKRLINIPVAVVLTKFDTILSHKSFAQNALIKHPSLAIRDGKVSLEEIRQVHYEIEHWLKEIREEAFIMALSSHFKEFSFFGVSSYGSPPKDEHTLASDIHPHRVLDPILWFFKKARFID